MKDALTKKNAQHYDTVCAYELRSKLQSSPPSRGIYSLWENYNLQAKFTFLARKIEVLMMKNFDHHKYIQDITCYICSSNDHSTKNCYALPTLKEDCSSKQML